MEPSSGLPQDIDQQSLFCNSSALIAITSPPIPSALCVSQNQPLKEEPVTQLSPCVKPNTLNLQSQVALQTSTQLCPPVQTNNNQVLSGTAASSSGSICNANYGSSPALASTATAISATTQAATAFSGSSVGHHNLQQHHRLHTVGAPVLGHQNQHSQNAASTSNSASFPAGGGGQQTQPQAIEKLSRPMAFDKMEVLVREMQDQEHGVPVRQQKMFLTSIPYAFMGYDLIEWLMDRLQIEESEALSIANQLCLHGYFFPVNDSKTLTVKDDSSLYRFQTPYYWPWQHKAPDNVEYAIYLAKRSLRNKQRHALEDYEAEALASLHKNLKGKWDFISMQAEEQVRLAKERKKGDKIVGDSQERAYWRVHRPPLGQFTPLEPCPVPSRDRQGLKPNKKKTVDDVQREVDYLGKSLNRTRMKMSLACKSLVCYSETFCEYDFFLQPALPSNPWVTEDITFWQLNSTFVDIPTEKRVRRWAISIEELVSDPTGLQEFTNFLEKEYSHENIRFWIAVNHLRRSAHSQVAHKVNEIFEEFLKPGAPCEINIDGKTMECVLKGLKNPTRFTFDSASEHIYMLLLKKDCYPRFVRSEHYKRLVESGIQPSHKKRFFNFGGVSGAKKKMTAALSSQPILSDLSKGSIGAAGAGTGSNMQTPNQGNLTRRRGSDRSLTGSAHELAVIGVNKDVGSKVPHSHSQNNLSEIPYREASNTTKLPQLETTAESSSVVASAICPWDEPGTIETSTSSTAAVPQPKLSVYSWERKSRASNAPLTSSSSDTDNISARPLTSEQEKFNAREDAQQKTSTCMEISEVPDRIQRNLGIRHQNTVDSGETGKKRLIPNPIEQRRASVSYSSSPWEHQFTVANSPSTTTTSPLVNTNRLTSESRNEGSKSSINKDERAYVEDKAKLEDNLQKLSMSQKKPEVSEIEVQILATSASTPTIVESTLKESGVPAYVVPLIQSQSSSTTAPPAVQFCEERESPTSSETVGTSAIKATVDRESNDSPMEIKEVQIELIKPHTCTSSGMQIRLMSTSKVGQLKIVENSADPCSSKDLQVADTALEVEEGHGLENIEAELSPTTDEYQEGMHFGDASKDAVYDYDIIDSKRNKCYVPPAPTPAPSMAPLAVLDVDTVDDDLFDESITVQIVAPSVSKDEERRRRKKRNSEGKKVNSLDEKDKGNEKASTSAQTNTNEVEHNAICPWEDENVSTSDGTFVKTYATLGYL